MSMGRYNPDWAFVREKSAGQLLYLVREAKGGSDIEKLRREAGGGISSSVTFTSSRSMWAKRSVTTWSF
ncbi:hypothetical protein ACFYE2_11625 [Kocuria sp. CPCC 205300]|uniref:restriction endonuclease n=1 Tax=Kocuria sabuli TaxID=3071448 RepID=UPI0036D88CCC